MKLFSVIAFTLLGSSAASVLAENQAAGEGDIKMAVNDPMNAGAPVANAVGATSTMSMSMMTSMPMSLTTMTETMNGMTMTMTMTVGGSMTNSMMATGTSMSGMSMNDASSGKSAHYGLGVAGLALGMAYGLL